MLVSENSIYDISGFATRYLMAISVWAYGYGCTAAAAAGH